VILLIFQSSDKSSSTIRLYDGRSGNETPLHVLDKIHRSPVSIMKYHPYAHTVVSIDEQGMMEYWDADPDHDFQQPKPPVISWELKSDTDLYEFKKVFRIQAKFTMK
jgi:peptidylprolyl isomerase domain and WD repeat-containing protein 1